MPKTFCDVIDLWPSIKDLAADVDEPYARVLKWRIRNNVPGGAWRKLLAAAKRRGYRVTAEHLVEIADKHRAA